MTRWANGTWTYCQANVIASDTSIGGVLCSLTDITDRKKLEAERKLALEAEEDHLRRRAELAEQQKTSQEFLVSVVSHEVSTSNRVSVSPRSSRVSVSRCSSPFSRLSKIRNPLSGILQCANLCQSNLSFIRNELHNAVESGQHYQPTSELVNLINEDLDGLVSIEESASHPWLRSGSRC